MDCIVEIIWQDLKENKEQEMIVKKVIQKCFEVEKINPTSLYVCVTLTTPENIRKINKKYRDIDKPTDVLSFPMFEKKELEKLCNLKEKYILGDIIISIPKVKQQAIEYEHSFEREFAYMLVHGFYHLRGYDHLEEEDKKQMREKEEYILSKLNLSRII